MTVVCAYFGPADECHGCGGALPARNVRMDRFCSDDCAASEHARRTRVDAEHAAQLAARRAREDAFARESDRLRDLGHTDEQIDVLLAHIPT